MATRYDAELVFLLRVMIDHLRDIFFTCADRLIDNEGDFRSLFMSPADISLTKWTDTIFQIGWGGGGEERWVGRRIFGNHIVFEGNERRSIVTNRE